jgi:hypothetical protein
VPKPWQCPLIVSPIIKDVKLNRILVDGGSSLNILFLKTFDQMGLSRAMLHPSQAPFHGIVPSVAATLIGQITLLITFGTQENFHTKNLQFEVADFEIAYNTFLGHVVSSPLGETPSGPMTVIGRVVRRSTDSQRL